MKWIKTADNPDYCDCRGEYVTDNGEYHIFRDRKKTWKVYHCEREKHIAWTSTLKQAKQCADEHQSKTGRYKD